MPAGISPQTATNPPLTATIRTSKRNQSLS